MEKTSHYRAHKRVQEFGQVVDSETGELVVPPSMTKQEFAKECDINNIMKQYSQTGMLRHVSANAAAGAYADLPDPIDFQDALHQVEAARQAFMTLPSNLRSRFGNDPVEFLAFCADPANAEEMRKLGLANPEKAPPEPITVRIEGSGGDGGPSPPSEGARAP